MLMITRSPPALLAPFIEHLWFYESVLTHEADHVLPTGRMQLLVNLAEDVTSMPAAIFSGPMTRPIVVDTAAMRRIAGVSFWPGGARPFLDMPCAELSNLDVELPAVWGSHGVHVRERLLEASTPMMALTTLAAILVEQVRGSFDVDRRLRRVLGLIEEGRTVADVVANSGASRSTLARRFSNEVGLSPKQYASVTRFQRAVRRLATGEPDLAEVAVSCGYYDQAHLTHEFRRHAGRTPGAYRPRNADEWNHVAVV